MSRFSKLYGERLRKLSSTNVSDALNAFGIHGFTCGIQPVAERWTEIIDPAVTVRMTAAGETKQKTHLGISTISAVEKGDAIVTGNGNRVGTSCWDGILANAAKAKGISGTMIDGCCHDLGDCMDANYIAYARGTVVHTVRGRMMEESTNQMIQFGGVQVRLGDTVMEDNSGMAIIPQGYMEIVLLKAEEPQQKEEGMVVKIRSGVDILEVGAKHNYNRMLQR